MWKKPKTTNSVAPVSLLKVAWTYLVIVSLLTNCGTNFGFCYSQLQTWATPPEAGPWGLFLPYSYIHIALSGIFCISWLTIIVFFLQSHLFLMSCEHQSWAWSPSIDLPDVMSEKVKGFGNHSSSSTESKTASNSSKQKVLWSYNLQLVPWS